MRPRRLYSKRDDQPGLTMKTYCLFIDEGRAARCTRCRIPLAGAAVRQCEGQGVSESEAIAAYRTCKNKLAPGASPPRCRHLGEPVRNREGEPVTVKVACSCPSGFLFHPSFECMATAKRRCLPTYLPAQSEWTGRPESQLYDLCGRCPLFDPS